MLASVGIGSAKLDTVLDKASYSPGEEVHGVVRIQGGSIEQRIDAIVLSVMTSYLREVNDSKMTQSTDLARLQVSEPLTINPNELREVPFSFYLPRNTPLSIGHSPVWIKTAADIQAAVDPTDEDRIHVMPSPYQRVVLDAVDQLGFRLRKSESVYAPRLGGTLPFVQELEWVPASGPYRGRLDELELMFLGNHPDGIHLLLQIDRKATSLFGMFAEAMDTDESFVKVSLGQSDLDRGVTHVGQVLNGIISRYAH